MTTVGVKIEDLVLVTNYLPSDFQRKKKRKESSSSNKNRPKMTYPAILLFLTFWKCGKSDDALTASMFEELMSVKDQLASSELSVELDIQELQLSSSTFTSSIHRSNSTCNTKL